MQGTVTLSIESKIARITLAHPRANALTPFLLQELVATLERLKDDAKVHVVILSTAGEKAFCGGAALDALAQAETAEEATAFFMGFAHLINCLRKFPKFVLVSVQGKCVGGAVGWIAACDYAIATAAADIKLSELSIGIGPFVIAPAVQRRIGAAAFAHLSIASQQWHTAAWAAQQGLFAKVVPSKEALDNAINSLAVELAEYPLKTIATLKELHWKDTAHWDSLLEENAKITAQLALEPFTKNKIKSLINK
jgi:methylglutaconyl-CoA hydratase